MLEKLSIAITVFMVLAIVLRAVAWHHNKVGAVDPPPDHEPKDGSPGADPIGPAASAEVADDADGCRSNVKQHPGLTPEPARPVGCCRQRHDEVDATTSAACANHGGTGGGPHRRRTGSAAAACRRAQHRRHRSGTARNAPNRRRSRPLDHDQAGCGQQCEWSIYLVLAHILVMPVVAVPRSVGVVLWVGGC